MAEYKTGDVVSLTSGGPKMTVQGTIGDLKGKPSYNQLKLGGYSDDQIVCKYWDKLENKFQINYFEPGMLKLSE